MPDKLITVTTYAGYKGDERPRSLVIDGVTVEVAGVVRTWIEEEAMTGTRRRFFTLQMADGTIRSVFLDDRSSWYLRYPDPDAP